MFGDFEGFEGLFVVSVFVVGVEDGLDEGVDFGVVCPSKRTGNKRRDERRDNEEEKPNFGDSTDHAAVTITQPFVFLKRQDGKVNIGELASVTAATAAGAAASTDGAFGDGAQMRFTKPGEISGGHRGMGEFSTFIRSDGGATGSAEQAHRENEARHVLGALLGFEEKGAKGDPERGEVA